MGARVARRPAGTSGRPAAGCRDGCAPTASGPVFARQPHLAFFLHDEVIVHTPATTPTRPRRRCADAAASAAALLFGDFPLDFPLDLRIAETAEKA